MLRTVEVSINIYIISFIFFIVYFLICNISLDGTSLMFAAKNGHLEVVKLLLENNADVQAKDNYGEY